MIGDWGFDEYEMNEYSFNQYHIKIKINQVLINSQSIVDIFSIRICSPLSKIREEASIYTATVVHPNQLLLYILMLPL